jgi:glycosyltransferase involved in cell wall biosynthesis
MIDRTETEIMKNWKGDISSPLASICTMTYNLENYVAEALDSLLAQETDFPFEMVIDDDCSSDATVEVLKKYIEKYPNIITVNFRKKNVGMRRNFIENMQRAKGKYLALCDGDDYWTDPLKLQKQVDFLEKNSEYVLTYSPLESIFEDGVTKTSSNWNTQDRDSLEIQKYFLRTGICAVCFRNVDIIKEYPFEYRCAPLPDHFLWSVLGSYGKGKFLKDIKAARYRMHVGGDYTGRSELERVMMNHQTDFALYMYYLRIGNTALSEFFHKKVVKSSFILQGRFYYIKMLLRSIAAQGIVAAKRFLSLFSR